LTLQRIIVTGGAGFIGSAVCRHLLGDVGVQVCNVDKLTYAASPAALAPVADNPNYRFEQIDICDGDAMAALFKSFQPQAIIHLAAESHVDRSIGGPGVFIQTNIVGTHTLLETTRAYLADADDHIRDAFRLLHVSTDEVFGSLDPSGYFLETTAYDPSSPYSASKAAADHLVTAWHRTYGLPALISNCSNNLGPYQFPEKLVPLMVLNAMEGKPLPVYGDGSNIRDWLYVDDHARALHTILTKGRIGQTYNIGARSERSNLQVVEAICDCVDGLDAGPGSRRALITYVDDRPGHDQRYGIDPTKIETELGWRAQETFESGLEKTIRWYFDNRAWWQPIRDGTYGGERLGAAGSS